MDKKRFLVLGGSNGIGLAIAVELLARNYFVEIFDVAEPDNILKKYAGNYHYTKFNLLDFDEQGFDSVVKDKDLKGLIITAGVGRLAEFKNVHISEISKVFDINTIGLMKVIKLFYDRIHSNDEFYCAVMGSIAGLINSPLFSIYSASKAAVCKFIESVNVELDIAETKNRILNVSPGHISGTKFDNKNNKNDIEKNSALSQEIIDRMFAREELYIPDYDTVYKSVLNRYHEDSHKFGVESYLYKKETGRIKEGKKVIVGYLSGTFDLFHVGHLNLLQRAKEQCDYLIVGVHLDASHKGKETFISYEERVRIVAAIKYVDKVVQSCREDSDAWDLWHYDKLFVGSDYKGTERFKKYEKYFKDKGIEIVYFPYTKGTSSTKLRAALELKINQE